MATFAPAGLLTGAPRIALPFGISSVVNWLPGDSRWRNGAQWETDNCDPLRGFGMGECDETNAVQTLTIPAETPEVQLGYKASQAPDAIAAATAAEVQATLEALPSIGAGNVVVTGADGGPYTITFVNQMGSQPVIAISAFGVGGPNPTVTIEEAGSGTFGLPRNFASDSEVDPENPYGLGRASAFTVYGWKKCSPVGYGVDLEGATADAREQLLSREDARVEQALWYGDLDNVPNFMGQNGSPAADNLGTFTLERALAEVEQALAFQYGAQGVIHMNRVNASLLKNRLESRGGRMFTRLGTPVVVGTGYGVESLFGTGALFGYRGEVVTNSNRPGDLLDRARNDLFAIAERDYLVGFDPCGFVSATITQEGQG